MGNTNIYISFQEDYAFQDSIQRRMITFVVLIYILFSDFYQHLLKKLFDTYILNNLSVPLTYVSTIDLG